MSSFVLDSSALVKRYVTETGTPWVSSLLDPVGQNTIIIAAITRVEVAAALASRHRTPNGITLYERDSAVALLEKHCATNYNVIQIDQAVLDAALELTQYHRLRGYDAVQLAVALRVNDLYLRNNLLPLTFICADSDLLNAAQSEGLSVDNPNAHP
jgi:uncharacterized protein